MSTMLLNIFKKEMKDAFRDKRTLILTVLLPILMMTALTFFYEGMMSDSEGDSYTLAVNKDLTEEQLALFEGDKSIDVTKVKNPENSVENGDALAAVVFSDDFMGSVQRGEEASVTIVGDSMSENSSFLMSKVSAYLTDFEKSVTAERLKSEGLEESTIQPFIMTQQELSEEDTGLFLIALIIPMMMALAIGIGAGPVSADLFAGEKEKKTMEALLITPVKRSTLLWAKWLTISSLGLITGMITLIVVIVEIAFFTENLRKGISFGDQLPLIVGLALVVAVVYAMFNASILMLTSIAGKTIKEAQSYSTPVMMLAVFPSLFISGVSVNELAAHHFLIPILNMFSILKELIYGVVDPVHLSMMIGTNLIVVVVIFIIGRIMFLKDKWVMN